MNLPVTEAALRRLEKAGYCIVAKSELPNDSSVKAVLPFAVQPRHLAVRMAVCEYFGVDQDELIGLGRTAAIAWPRMIGMYVARTHLHLTLVETALLMNRTDHTTACNAMRKVQAALDDPDRAAETALDVEYVRRRAVTLRAQMINRLKLSS